MRFDFLLKNGCTPPIVIAKEIGKNKSIVSRENKIRNNIESDGHPNR